MFLGKSDFIERLSDIHCRLLQRVINALRQLIESIGNPLTNRFYLLRFAIAIGRIFSDNLVKELTAELKTKKIGGL
jgi:hypothetical protein